MAAVVKLFKRFCDRMLIDDGVVMSIDFGKII